MPENEGRPSLLGDDGWTGDPSEDPLYSDIAEAEAPETEAAGGEGPQATEETATEPAEQATTSEDEQTEDEQAEPGAEPITFADRQFPNMDEAARSYKSALDDRRHQATRANRAEAAARQAIAEMAALRQMQRTAPAPAPAIDPAALEQLGIDPAAGPLLQQYVEGELARRLAPVEQRFQAEAAQRDGAEADRSRAAAITTFRTAHPDAASKEETMVSFLHEIGATDEQGLGPSDPAWYEIAYEAATDPALAGVLRANPDWAETDEGMDLARSWTRQMKAQQALETQPGQTAPGSAPAPAPHVLSGPANTQAGNATPAQPDAIDEFMADERARKRSPWAGGPLN